MCGTSRFSTVTGRYPSRSAYGRAISGADELIRDVTIPNTKLQDVTTVSDGNDCSENNLAALLQQNGYRTGVVGKWHLHQTTDSYSYTGLQDQIRACGFEFAESIYAQNLNGNWHDGTFSHNMEYMTAKGIEFITEDPSEPFFLYFNPTAPHSAGNVLEALTTFPCTATSAGELFSEPVVKGMTEGTNCEAYRQTVIDRANGATDNNAVGSIWLDDAIGALLMTLEDLNQLNNTFFLFQMDHGQEGKGTIWEPGIRMAQFIHFPDEFAESQFFGMVSTIDIGPTILDYAGIDETALGYYEMDGKSWRPAVEDATIASTWDDDRCLFFEIDQDRAMRCGCYKYMSLQSGSDTRTRGDRNGLASGTEIIFNLCDANGKYVQDSNQEVTDVETGLLDELRSFNECHLDRVRPSEEPYYSECGNTAAPSPVPSPFCFSGENTVEVKDRGPIKMRELKLGDEVLVADGSHEAVYSFGHRQDTITAEYVQLLPSKLELSANHMVFVLRRGAIPASMVQLGDVLSNGEAVTSIHTVRRRGMYAPFTRSGTIMVNDVVASNYIAFKNSELLLVGDWRTTLTFQWLAHTFEAPHRLSCNFLWDCSYESYSQSGVSVWVAYPLEFSRWILDQHALVQILVLAPLIVVFVAASVFETGASFPLLLSLPVLAVVWFRRSQRHKICMNR